MTTATRHSWVADAIRGAIAGWAATWVMDLVTTGMVDAQSEASKRREAAARPNDQSAVANLIDRIASAWGVTLDDRQRAAAAQAVHYGLGVVPGALYAVARRRLPVVGSSRGLVYGVGLWAINDEYLNTALGLAGPIGAYPVETHWRGLVGHAVLGMVTDGWSDVLGR